MPITIVTGPPGAGKTTVAGRLARSRPLSVHLLSDQMFEWVASGFISPWLPGSASQNATVIAAIATSAGQFAKGGYDVFVDGIIGPWFLRHWITTADLGEPIQYVVLRPSREVALARATARDADGELVDPEPIIKMFDAFADLGEFEAHVLDSSNQDVDATVESAALGLSEERYVLQI